MQQQIGRYRVLGEIASGGQATVYRALDPDLGRSVALKVLHPHLSSDPQYIERFLREARMAASLNHPNIVTIFEVGKHGEQHFIAMEYIPQSLFDIIKKQGSLSTATAVDICHQTALALQSAYQKGITHRDIKPHNILMTEDGVAKLTDFGIARAADFSAMTRTGLMMGTPHYMSPEQALGQRADIRSDIYSLGCVLYQMLTGELPFDAETPWEVMRQHVEAQPRPIRELKRDISSPLERVVNQCLSKDPSQRFRTPQALVSSLERVTNGTGTQESTVRTQQTVQSQPPHSRASATQSGAVGKSDFQSQRRRGKGLFIGLASISTLMAIGLGALLIGLQMGAFGNNRNEQPAPPQAAATTAPAAPAPTAFPLASAPAPPQAAATAAPAAAAPAAPATIDIVTPIIVPAQAVQTTPAVATPRGTLTIAVPSVYDPNGLPRFCTGGCSEAIYLSGATETLFNAKGLPNGTVTTEPLLALEFRLDPSLEGADFSLRNGVQFHKSWGPMTARDVAFSFNDANSATNPESIHGQAGEFSSLIASMEVIDDTTVHLNYRDYDSRGILHRFSSFWQTAGITSKSVFDQRGVEGMEDEIVGVGPFVVDNWTAGRGIFMTAFEDYWGSEEDMGPFVQNIRWIQVPEDASRNAMLQTGESQIAQVELRDVPTLVNQGFEPQKGGKSNTMHGISFAGNYWENFNGQTGDVLQRDRGSSSPWVGNPFENGSTYDPSTPSMISSMKVRNAFAWSIDREAILESLNSGMGFVNHQPYLSTTNPNYRDEWSWGFDPELSRSLLAEAGFPRGSNGVRFDMDFWVGTNQTGAELGEVIATGWEQNLGTRMNLIMTEYSTYRPGLVARTTATPGLSMCLGENVSSFPYDWAHGFYMSGIKTGGFGVGQELPYATEAYLGMEGEPDKAKRAELAANFYTRNKTWANCVGIFEEPIWPMYNSEVIVEWDQRPNANRNLGGINNLRSIRIK